MQFTYGAADNEARILIGGKNSLDWVNQQITLWDY